MLASIVEGANLALQVAHDKDRRAGVARQEPASGFGKLIGMAGVQPSAVPHPRLFEREKGGIDIALPGNVGQLGKARRRFRTPALVIHTLLEPRGGGRVHADNAF